MTLFFYITNTPKNSVETLSTLDTMKIPLHREDQTKISFKTELNGSYRFYTTITKKKKKKCGWKPGTLSTLNTKELLLQMDVTKKNSLNIEIHVRIKCFPTIKIIQPKENGENVLGSYLMEKHGCWRTVLWLNTCAWSKENDTMDLILVLDPKKIMKPRLNYKQPRSFGIYLALTLIKKICEPMKYRTISRYRQPKKGNHHMFQWCRFRTKHRTHIEQISYIEIWQSPTYNVPQFVCGT